MLATAVAKSGKNRRQPLGEAAYMEGVLGGQRDSVFFLQWKDNKLI